MGHRKHDEVIDLDAESTTETPILQDVLVRVGAREDYVCWRNNSGQLRNHLGRAVRFGCIGSSDVLGCFRGGLFLGIEVKVPGREPSDDQKRWRRAIEARGGVVLLAHSPDEAQEGLDALARRADEELVRVALMGAHELSKRLGIGLGTAHQIRHLITGGLT